MIEDSFIEKYYTVSVIFIVFSTVEAIFYFMAEVSPVNLTFLLFELVWLFYSFIIFLYILVSEYPKQILLLPTIYLLYFLVSLVYTLFFVLRVMPIDAANFMRNTALIILCFSALALFAAYSVWYRFFRRWF